MALSIRRQRPIRATAAVLPAPIERRGVRASAQRFPLTKKTGQVTAKRLFRREWQDEAWEYFDDVPEIKYSTWFMGNVMAKCKLYCAVLDPNDPDAPPIPASDPDAGLPSGIAARAQAEIDRLTGPLGGRAEILRALNMNLEIAGEGFIIGFGPREIPVTDDETGEPTGQVDLIPEAWGVFSVSQVTEKDGSFTVKMRPDDAKSVQTLNASLDSEPIRVFQRHARWSLEADCNMRGCLSACEALVLLDNSIKAEAKSRMGAGWLLIPNELSTGPDIESQPEDGEEAAVDPFLQELYDALVDPIEDPSSASAVAPPFIRGPADALEQFRHVVMERPSDAQILDKITALIERIARGMNLPVEVVMGHQQTTFANAMQVKQDTFDDHFQPRCVLICDALTVGFLRPNLIAAGLDETIAERLVVWFDPSAMIKQVNPVDSADAGIAADLISGEAWRRAWGWSEDDAPDPVERLVRAVMHLRTFDPGISTAILELLGVPLDIPNELPSTGTAPVRAALDARYPTGSPRSRLDRLVADLIARDPTLRPVLAASAKALPAAKRNVGRELMYLDRELRTKLIVAASDALTRALERAGNRLRAKAGQTQTLARAGFVHPVYVAATLGPNLIASAGFAEGDLIGADSWNGLEAQWRTWVAAAQERALGLAESVVTIAPGAYATLAQQQARDLDNAWDWLKGQLATLAAHRLFSPDPAEPSVGEFDPSARVPAGLIRQALARAGGAKRITQVQRGKAELRAAVKPKKPAFDYPGADEEGTPIYVAVDNGKPLGGIGTGDLILGAITDGGGGIDGYQWEYGPAFRLHPFEPHDLLDQVPFVNFDDPQLTAGDWIGAFYFPGDHDGCSCDVTPVILDAAAFADAADDSGVTDLGDAP